ncbi:MAG: nucleotidyltransferase family protein [Hyphomicrobiales bacterium]|nr:MAG: nucleotidyltransferase family protein [Hyphomicrobiales bacterium]
MAELSDVTVALLAAGLSRRYGAADKLLAAFNGKPLASHAADMLAALPFARHVAVCSPTGPLGDSLVASGFTLVPNAEPERGLGHSLSLAVKAATGHSSVLLICLADMPLVTPAHLLDLIGRANRSTIVASVADATAPPMPPVSIGRDYFARLSQLDGDQGARPLLATAIRVVAPPGTLRDFDTPEDFG